MQELASFHLSYSDVKLIVNEKFNDKLPGGSWLITADRDVKME